MTNLFHIKSHSSVYGGCPVLMSGDATVEGRIVFPIDIDRLVHITAWDTAGEPLVDVDSQNLLAPPGSHWVAVGVKVF